MQIILRRLKKSLNLNNEVLNACHPDNLQSLKNLLRYLELRKRDISEIQKKLYQLGLSTLDMDVGSIESEVFKSLKIVEALIGDSDKAFQTLEIDDFDLAHRRKDELLGKIGNRRKVRIMVTLPSEAATDYHLVRSFVDVGMNVARINCAHDSTEDWERMIRHVKDAEKELGKKVKIAMDLAGPKIRTGDIPRAFSVKKVSPSRNEIGKAVNPFHLMLTSFNHHPIYGSLVVDEELIHHAHEESTISYKDPRGKKRKLKVIEKGDGYLKIEGWKTTYFQKGGEMILGRKTYIIQEVPMPEPFLLVKAGSTIRLKKEGAGFYPETSEDMIIPEITCTLSSVLDDIQVGEVVFFDDGKIEGMVVGKEAEGLVIKISRAKLTGSKLRANKGINFPKSRLAVSGLTAKDKTDLSFVCKYSDIINFSFVNCAQDVHELLREIDKNKKLDQIGIILKIETARAFNNLPEILIACMQTRPLGVMVARGDLAIEVGWKKLGTVIKEVLYICNAAHVPMVWATQVLEGLSKTGTPTRSEIIDAVISSNSGCIMLNKGPYILDAISLLNELIKQFEAHRQNEFESFKKLEQIKTPSNKKHLQNA